MFSEAINSAYPTGPRRENLLTLASDFNKLRNQNLKDRLMELYLNHGNEDCPPITYNVLIASLYLFIILQDEPDIPVRPALFGDTSGGLDIYWIYSVEDGNLDTFLNRVPQTGCQITDELELLFDDNEYQISINQSVPSKLVIREKFSKFHSSSIKESGQSIDIIKVLKTVIKEDLAKHPDWRLFPAI